MPMNNTQQRPEKSERKVFFTRLIRNFVLGISLITISLIVGMCGYRYFEGMSWVDAYANAAMILSGMGPISPLNTDAGKIFAGTYAIFCGIFFLIFIAIIAAPLFHHFFHKLLLRDNKN